MVLSLTSASKFLSLQSRPTPAILSVGNFSAPRLFRRNDLRQEKYMPKSLLSGLPPLKSGFARRMSVRRNPAEVDIHALLLQLRHHRTRLNKTIIILDRVAKGLRLRSPGNNRERLNEGAPQITNISSSSN